MSRQANRSQSQCGDTRERRRLHVRDPQHTCSLTESILPTAFKEIKREGRDERERMKVKEHGYNAKLREKVEEEVKRQIGRTEKKMMKKIDREKRERKEK